MRGQKIFSLGFLRESSGLPVLDGETLYLGHAKETPLPAFHDGWAGGWRAGLAVESGARTGVRGQEFEQMGE